MKRLLGWFTSLKTAQKVAVVIGASLIGLGTVGAMAEPPAQTTPPTQTIEEVKTEETPEIKKEVKTEVVTKEIPYETVRQDDSSIDQGIETVAQEGQNGIRKITYEVSYENGKEVSRKEVSNEVTTAMVSRRILVGTYVAPPPPVAQSPDCDPNYSGGCVPNVSYDLDCADIGFSVSVLGYDPHGFDRDEDGYGCESY